MLMPEVVSNVSCHSPVFLSELCVRLIEVLLPSHGEPGWFCLPSAVSLKSSAASL